MLWFNPIFVALVTASPQLTIFLFKENENEHNVSLTHEHKQRTHLHLVVALGGHPDELEEGPRGMGEGRVDLEARLAAVAALDGGVLAVAGLDGPDDADDHPAEVAGRQEGAVEAGVVSVCLLLGRHGCCSCLVLNEDDGAGAMAENASRHETGRLATST